MVRIGIVGCGRILNAHLRGFRILRENGYDDFRITALTARRREDADSHLVRGEGPPQRPPVTPPEAGDPLGVPDEYLSDFQTDVEVGVFTDYREMIQSGTVDAVNDYTSVSFHHKIAELALNAGLHLLSQKPVAVSVAVGPNGAASGDNGFRWNAGSRHRVCHARIIRRRPVCLDFRGRVGCASRSPARHR